jgi:opacity protein-like surface antigen
VKAHTSIRLGEIAGRQQSLDERRRRGGRLIRRSAFLSLAVLAFVATSGPAWAADMRLFVKARPAPVVNPWNGFYLGAHGGYGWSKKKFVDNFPVYDGEIDAEPLLQGGLGGFQLGYNYRTDWLLLGVEGEFSWSDIKNNDFSCFSFGDQVCSATSEWFAALAGRIGYVNGPALFYAKGGAVWTRDHFTNLATCAGSQPTSRDGVSADCGVKYFADQNRLGWLIGGGIEYLIAANWSLKIEYNYMDFGGRSVSFGDGDTGFFTEEIHQRVNVVKAGFNYHFGGGASASSNGEFSGRSLVFSGFDVSNRSYSGLAGAFIAPYGDLNQSGLRLFILGQAGTYKYPGDSGYIRGTYTGGDLLVGYGFEGDNYSINLLAGGNAANHMLSEIDVDNSVRGTAFGGKARADAWINPTPETLVAGEAEYSTAFRTYYSIAKLGYDVTAGRRVFVGPEVVASGDERSNQWRVGGHITQLKVGKIQVDISGGYAHDSSIGAGGYTNVGFSTAF